MSVDSGASQTRGFFDAVKGGDVDAVRLLLLDRPDLATAHETREFDATPLNLAVARGDLAMVDCLLELGADIDRKSAWWAGGFAPIHTALSRGDVDLALALAERGATVDAHAAAGLGDLEVLQALVAREPDRVRERGGDGQLPLHFSATPAVAAFLLEHGAELDARDVDHVGTAAQWAARSRPEVARFLVERGAERDPFLLAAIGEAELLDAWLEDHPEDLGARVNEERFPAPGSEASHIYAYTLGANATLLHAAARCDRPVVIDVLVRRGLNVNVRGEYDDCAPLHIAAWENNLSAAAALLDAGADIDLESGAIHTTPPSVWAIVNGQVEMVRFLIERGAPVGEMQQREAHRGKEGGFRDWCSAGPEVFEEIVAILDGALQ